MPVANNNQNKTPFAKYSLFLSDTYGGTYTKFKRGIILNFRNQLRGLGACGVTILPRNQINNQLTDTIREGQFVKILDTTKYFEDTYQSVGEELFVGTVGSVTSDIYKKIDDDKGYASIDEIGVFYNKKPIVWASKPQVFNPIVGAKAYGNKKPDEQSFETLLSSMATIDMDGTNENKFANNVTNVVGNSRVWSLQNFLSYMADIHNVAIKFPWEFDANKLTAKANLEKVGVTNPDAIAKIDADLAKTIAKNEEEYKAFKDTTALHSYDHYDGKSFQELLSAVIEEPFDWIITGESTSSPTFQIVNKSPVKAIDWCPSATLVKKELDNTITTNFNITKSDEVYDRVIYRGDNILVTGTLSHWNNNGAGSIVAGWTGTEEQTYVNQDTVTEGKFGITANAIADSNRAIDRKVYQEFTYRHIAESCPIQIAKKVEEVDKVMKYTQAPFYATDSGQLQYDMVPFFPRIDFVNYENGVPHILSSPKVYSELGLHKTPPLLEIKWSETLPWKIAHTKEMRKGFIVAQSFSRSGSDGIARHYTYDLTKSGGGYDTFELKHTADGYTLGSTYPQVLGYYDDELFKCVDTLVDTPAYYWDDKKFSDRNPAVTKYNFFTSYKMMASTLAGFSDQKLEWAIDNPKSTSTQRVKIIEDTSLQCWYVHGGTIKEVINSPIGLDKGTRKTHTNGYDRFYTDKFLRNDFKKVYDGAVMASNWLFTPKSSAKIEISLVKYTGGWNLGEVIGVIMDGKIQRTINTPVASIEYDCVSNRVNISTSIPEMPVLKQLQQAPISRSVTSPSSDSKEATLSAADKVITKKDYPTHGKISGGSASPPETQTIPVITVLNGSDAQQTYGLDVVKVPTTDFPTISSITSDAKNYLDGSVAFPDGFGVGRLATDGSYVYIANKNFGQILFAGDKFLSTTTMNVSGGIIPASSPATPYAIIAYTPELLL